MALDALQEKLRYEALLASIGEGLIVTDKSGCITTYNKAAESMLGWTPDEAIGKAMHEIMIVEYKYDQSANSPKIGTHTPLYFVRKNKTKFPAVITTTSYIQGASVLGTINLFRDVSIEQNIDSMKNEFISLASHQLRTPLSAIKWYSDMLIKGDAGRLLPEQILFAQSIFSSTERMIDLVNSLLNISRIESGRVTVEPKLTDIKKLVEEVLQEVKIHYANKQHDLIVTIPDTIPEINLDPLLIRQVYLNLLTNAFKYTPEKGKISVTLSRQDTNIVSEISDSGYGIPQEEQQRIFDKFYRGSNITDTAHDGNGLGLYFVKSILELSQGKIWFKSKEAEGTTFSFSIPVTGSTAKKGVVTLDS